MSGSIQKLIEENFSIQAEQGEDDYDDYDSSLFKGSGSGSITLNDLLPGVNDDSIRITSSVLSDNFRYNSTNTKVVKSKKKKNVNDDLSGSFTIKSKKRKSISKRKNDESVQENSSNSELSNAEAEQRNFQYDEQSDIESEELSSNSDELSDDTGEENEMSVDDEQRESGSDSDENSNESIGDESEIEDDAVQEEPMDTSFCYLKSMRNVSDEVEKGIAVKNQLSLWEVLLENRIILQKSLTECNELPKPEYYSKLLSECFPDDKKLIFECRESLWNLLEKLLFLQDKYRKLYLESGKQSNDEEGTEDEEENDEMFKIKRRKLVEYPDILKERLNKYSEFRNDTIQKWNDRTKIASGKLAKSNFSAFDQPIVKQIEQIMNDKERLIEKTRIKRKPYKIIGEIEENEEEINGNSNESNTADYEIFDDYDFYNKMLMNFIERKTAEITDPTQYGSALKKLQSLRTYTNKMKRKIDTKRTKGRKLKFDVHNKLVNFKAPELLNRWQDKAISELFNCVFVQ